MGEYLLLQKSFEKNKGAMISYKEKGKLQQIKYNRFIIIILKVNAELFYFDGSNHLNLKFIKLFKSN